MTRTRLAVIVIFLGSAALIAFVGFTDSALTEWRVAWPPPLVIGLIALLTWRRTVPKVVVNESDWKGPNPALLHVLGAQHRFTPAALEANRAGRLTQEQIDDGVSSGRGQQSFGGVMLTLGQLVVLLGLATQFFPRALIDVDFTFAWPKSLGMALVVGLLLGGVPGSVPLVLGLVSFRSGSRISSAFRGGKAQAVEGQLELLEVRRSRSGSSWFYVIEGLRFAVSHDAWRAMAQRGGGRYRVYFVPGMSSVLSLEPA